MMGDYDLPEVDKWLDGFISDKRGIDWRERKLEVMGVMTEYFRHPERSCPCFHVAGSKGKGTIAASAAAILTAAGKKVGVYMSPHVLHFTERVRSGEGAFPPEVYQRAFEILKKGVYELTSRGKLREEEVTWYELVTMFGMLVFREAEVDWAVYEVGMGGRLDATNVILPKAVGMGVIELEHTEFLGDTIEKIAREKAGVFKPGVPIFSVKQVNEARCEFAQKAREVGAKIEYVPEFGGDYVKEDKEVARRMVMAVCPFVSEKVAERGLKEVNLPGRYEKMADVAGVKMVVMDGAHTVESVKAVLARLKREEVGGVLVFGCAKDKRVEEMAREIAGSQLFMKVFLTRPGEGKEADLPRAVKAFEEAGCEDLVVEADYDLATRQALERARKIDGNLIVLGSFYLVGEAKKVIFELVAS